MFERDVDIYKGGKGGIEFLLCISKSNVSNVFCFCGGKTVFVAWHGTVSVVNSLMERTVIRKKDISL